jgi:hypothetical protein
MKIPRISLSITLFRKMSKHGNRFVVSKLLSLQRKNTPIILEMARDKPSGILRKTQINHSAEKLDSLWHKTFGLELILEINKKESNLMNNLADIEPNKRISLRSNRTLAQIQ